MAGERLSGRSPVSFLLDARSRRYPGAWRCVAVERLSGSLSAFRGAGGALHHWETASARIASPLGGRVGARARSVLNTVAQLFTGELTRRDRCRGVSF